MPSYDTADLQNYADSQASAYGIPSDYFSRLFEREGGWNPFVVSSKGAEGIAQLMPETSAGHVDPFDPKASINYAATLLSGYFKQFGNWDSAFAAYNAGPGAVKKYGGVPPYSETQNYVDFITGKLIGPEAPAAAPVSAGGMGVTTVPASAQNLSRIIVWTAALIALIFGIRLVLK